VDLLIDALEQLETSDWEKIEFFRIFGGGPLDHNVRRRTAALASAGRPVSLGGYLDKADAEDLISGSDWLLIPSRIESIPLIYSDALRLTTPVIATPVGDLKGLVRDQQTGILCEATTDKGIKAAIREALEQFPAEYMERLRLAGNVFDLRKIVETLVKT
jgi:glycosyltransferase involved in cell wall biosynthesis